ncbi:MAG: hypothetical protein Q7T82_09690 [Armatimonadota bacterium]|nr:hypothetical protein [Armatimonadota bacterium]
MTSKERILAAINHREADRVPMWENYWGSTMTRWRSEGLPENADLVSCFGLDPQCVTGVDWTLQFRPETIEETDEYIISRTNNGVMQKSFLSLQVSLPGGPPPMAQEDQPE